MLTIIRTVLDALNSNEINYIHFKSNEHLNESYSGDTDFDILVSQKDFHRFTDILETNGFKQYRSVGKQAYIGVFDYLYLDESGKVIHFHLHCMYITGTKFLKEYHIPIENALLSSARYDEEQMIRVISPDYELCLLWIRYFSKTSVFRYILKKGHISSNFLKEEAWLRTRADEGRIRELFLTVFPNENELCKEYQNFLKGERSFASTLRLLRHIRKNLSLYKGARWIECRYIMRRIGMMLRYFVQKYSHLPIPYRRVLMTGGKIIAVVGCDGAGKSTVNASVLSSIKKKSDVFFEYFGSGDGHCYWYRYPLLLVRRLLDRKGSKGGGAVPDQPAANKKVSVSKAIWAILLAKEKKSKLKRINAAKSKGMTVLCDRYPQTQFSSINDGPLLSAWENAQSEIRKRIARWERDIYERASFIKPDLVIKLMITEEVSRMRKPNEKPDRIRSKIALVKELDIPAEKMVVVDATESLNEVLAHVYSSISKCLSDSECH